VASRGAICQLFKDSLSGSDVLLFRTGSYILPLRRYAIKVWFYNSCRSISDDAYFLVLIGSGFRLATVEIWLAVFAL